MGKFLAVQVHLQGVSLVRRLLRACSDQNILLQLILDLLHYLYFHGQLRSLRNFAVVFYWFKGTPCIFSRVLRSRFLSGSFLFLLKSLLCKLVIFVVYLNLIINRGPWMDFCCGVHYEWISSGDDRAVTRVKVGDMWLENSCVVPLKLNGQTVAVG